MEACPRLVAKGGAEGLECVGLHDRGLGIAVKCEDGQSRAVPPALLGLLEYLGELGAAELSGLRSWKEPELRNHAGVVVGELEASVGTLAPVSPA
jgi:L-asparaginase II